MTDKPVNKDPQNSVDDTATSLKQTVKAKNNSSVYGVVQTNSINDSTIINNPTINIHVDNRVDKDEQPSINNQNNKLNNLPAIPEHFTGRELDVETLKSKIVEKRLITIKGTPGIGKTGLAIKIGHTISEEETFKDGIYFISLRNTTSEDSIRFTISEELGFETKSNKEFFNHIRTKSYLLILDNCETPLNHIFIEFRQFISTLLNTSINTKLLLTSRQSVGGGITGISEYVHPLDCLTKIQAASLFLAVSPRVILPSEIGTENYEQAKLKLANHPVLEFLSGHPHAIMLATPLLEDKSLEQLEQLIKEYKVKTLQVVDIPEDQHDQTTNFTVSLNISIHYVKEKCPDAIKLFSLMGLLPGKYTSSDTKEIFGQNSAFLMDKLVRASLIERRRQNNFEYFFSYPFITDFAYNLLKENENQLQAFSISTSDYFAKLIADLYSTLFNKYSLIPRFLFTLEENNFVACLDDNRPYRAKLDSEEAHPLGMIATYLAQIFMFFHRYNDVLRTVETGIKLCEKIVDKHSQANLLKIQGQLEIETNELEKAKTSLESAMQLYKSINYVTGIVMTYNKIGDLFLLQGNLDEAEKYYTKGLSYFEGKKEHQQSKETLANIYHALGKLSIRKGSLNDAENYLLKANDIYKSSQNSVSQGNIFCNLAEIKQRQQLYSEAENYLNLSLNYHNQSPTIFGIANTLLQIGILKMSQNEYALANKHFEESLTASKEKQYNLGIINALESLATLHSKQGNTKKATDYLTEALSVLEHFDYPIGEANIRSRLGEIQILNNNLTEAKKNIDTAFALYKECKDLLGEANCYFKLGKLFHAKKDYNSALGEYFKALNIHSQQIILSYIISDLNWMAMALKDLKRYEEAITVASEALTIEIKIDDKTNQSLTLLLQCETFYAMDSKKAAMGAAFQAKEIIRFALPDVAMSINQFLSSFYKLLQNASSEQIQEHAKNAISAKTQLVEDITKKLVTSQFIQYLLNMARKSYTPQQIQN